jgi:hypothetical protein
MFTRLHKVQRRGIYKPWLGITSLYTPQHCRLNGYFTLLVTRNAVSSPMNISPTLNVRHARCVCVTN